MAEKKEKNFFLAGARMTSSDSGRDGDCHHRTTLLRDRLLDVAGASRDKPRATSRRAASHAVEVREGARRGQVERCDHEWALRLEHGGEANRAGRAVGTQDLAEHEP